MRHNEEKIIEQWKQDEKAYFEGWDFSYIKARKSEDKTPWNYVTMAKNLAKKSSSLLDIDTGGGEILLKVHPPKSSYAMEGYKPNIKVARRNLEREGIKVIEANSTKKFPFKDNTFDLVLNRHGAINAKEIYRVLKQGGKFLTQQVDAKVNLVDLIRAFDSKPKWQFNNLKYRKKELEETGFRILKAKERKGKIVFKDVGAIVYFLKAIPWLVDGFSVKTHLPYLEILQQKLDKNGKLAFTLGNFLLLAEKGNI